MLCELFRHIDLEEVYKNLQSDTFFNVNASNIPEAFRETLSYLFEIIAEIAFDPDDDWSEHNAIDVGAEVGDIIEADIEQIAMEADLLIPSQSAAAAEVINTLRDMCFHTASHEYDYWQKISLLLYQYDLLCWFHGKGEIDHLLDVYELTLRTYGEIQVAEKCHQTTVTQSRAASNIARERAKKRHASTNQKKTELLDEWARTSAEYKSRADFCRILSRRDGVKERTLYEWIQAYERERT